MSLVFDFKGVREMRRNIAALKRSMNKQIGPAAKAEGSEIVRMAKADYVPVSKGPNSGKLRASGKVHPPERDSTGTSVKMTFGGSQWGNDFVYYAVAVHEHPSTHSPMSWRGKVVVFTRGGPKYLEKPMKEQTAGMAGRLAKRIELKL